MSQRFTLDSQSFEQFLTAASLLQHIHREALRHRGGESRQPLLEWFEIQQAVETGRLDFWVIVKRIVGLVQSVVGASGAGVWFFTRQEFAYFAGVGNVSDDERLRLQILLKLAACQPADSALPTITQLQRPTRIRDSGTYPGRIKSLLVAPIYHGSKVAGVLAGFSPDLDAFTERDTENARFLAGLLAQALDKAVEAELRQSTDLEWAAMLQLIEKMTPSVQKPLTNEEQIRHRSPQGFPRAQVAEPELPPAALSSEIPTLCETQSETPASEDFDSTSEEESVPAEAAQPLGSSSVNWPAIPRASFLWLMLRAQSPVLRLWESSRGVVRRVSRYQPKLRAIGKWTEDLALELRHSGLGSSVKNARNELLRYYRLDTRAARHVAAARAVLLITLVFLVVEMRMHKASRSEAAGSVSAPEARALPTGSSNARISSNSTPTRGNLASKLLPRESEHRVESRPFQLSHLQITDRETDTELRNMTRYEISKLRKNAQYGDDTAAFQLGMAYEIGYDVPQNCVQAANWVARSANQGNVAAEYNLGLRYRDGDGATANPEEAEKWLRKAAAQKHADAQLALEALTSHQAHAAVSQP